MDDILLKIDEIISKKYPFKINAVGGKYFFEKKNESQYPQTVIKQKRKMLVFSFDLDNSNDTIFSIFDSSVPSLTTVCDYIVFYPKGEKLYTFICDLKTSSSSAKVQVEASFLLSKYIVETACRMMNFKEIQVEYRALIFSLSSRSQFSTSISNEPYVVLGNSGLKNKLLKAGETCFLDNLCF